MKLCGAALIFLALADQAAAGQRVLYLSTWPARVLAWKVYEVSGGQVVSGTPVYIGPHTYGKVPAYTVPFTDNDGFWYLQTTFTLPPRATNPMLHVIQFGVDDRAVLQLNGVDVTGVGTTTSGSGEMQFSDPGSTAPYNFANVSGQHAVTSSAGFQTGLNTLAIIDNNTNSGIFGSITPITGGDPSNVGLQSYVTYTYP